MLRDLIKETIREGAKSNLTEDEVAVQVINKLDEQGLSLSGNGWLDGDYDYESLLESSNKKLNK